MIKEVNGNLLTYPGIQVMGHQTNCLGAFGKGFALQVKQKYPYVYETYNKYCKSQSDKHNLLGTIQVLKTDEPALDVYIVVMTKRCGRVIQQNNKIL